MLRILVAGATGVLGRAVVPRVVAAGHAVLGVSRGETADRWLADAGARPVRRDLFDADDATQLAADERVKAIVNLATNVPRGLDALRRRAWSTHLRLRGDAARALAIAAIGAEARFAQESFAAAYPDRGDVWIDEDVPLAPVVQAGTVPDAEASAEQVAQAGGAGVALRFGLLYGPDASTELLAAARAEYAAVLAELLDVARLRPLPRVLGRLPLLALLARSQRISNARFTAETGWRPAYPGPRSGWSQVMEAVDVRG